MTHWSSRLLAKRVGLHFTQVARVWRHWGVQPWREETFKFSTDPQLEAKVRDVVGLSEATEPSLIAASCKQDLIHPLRVRGDRPLAITAQSTK